MSRGHAEAIITGNATDAQYPSSIQGFEFEPYRLVLSNRAKVAFAPIAEKLQILYRDNAGRPRIEIEQLIEREYRDWLTANICKPLRVYGGGCLAMAFEVAREGVSNFPACG